MSKEIIHSITLSITIAFSFFFVKSSFNQYELQIIGLIFILYFLIKNLLRLTSARIRFLDAIVFTFIITTIIISSGGLQSNFFFLYYFLLFALSLLLEPIIAFTATATIITFYLITANHLSMPNLMQLFSLVFLTPFALLVGQEFNKIVQQKVKIQKMQKKMTKNKEDELLFLSLILKTHIKSIKHTIENFTGDNDLDRIKKIIRRVEHIIEEYESQ